MHSDSISETNQVRSTAPPPGDNKPYICKQENSRHTEPMRDNSSPPQMSESANSKKDTAYLTQKRCDTNRREPDNPNRYDYTPYTHHVNVPTSPRANQDTLDFAKFLTRHELVTISISKFNDRPENFRAWQSSFQNAIKVLGLSHSEEMDLNQMAWERICRAC